MKSDAKAKPQDYKIQKLSAHRLSDLTGLQVDDLAGSTIGDLAERFRFQIDPQFLFMRKVCGKVVKTDPVTGIEYPVPFATVEVQDTDCNFLGYFPSGSPWSWFFPFNCKREVIATTKTDECGNFCVWIPRFDIDWVIRWRKFRICLPIVFKRPDLGDIIDTILPEVIPDFPPRPLPDPPPFDRLDPELLINRVGEHFGEHLAQQVARISSPPQFGQSIEKRDGPEISPALLRNIRPEFPQDLREAMEADCEADNYLPGLQNVAERLTIDPGQIEGVDLRRYIGPFKRCHDIYIPTWTRILDVPDITFRVLQDVDGDGTEEQIYGEGYFDVRWNAGTLSNIKLEADPTAIAGPICGTGEPIPCGDTPAIVMAGRLPLTGAPDIFNPVTGYALKMNRPHPSGEFGNSLPVTQAASPLRRVLPLYGCKDTDPGASHYRIMYEYSANNGATFSSPAPFLGTTWPLFRLDGSGNGETHWVTPDGNGWYPLALPAGPNAWLPQDLLIDWHSYKYADGLYRLRLQLGSGGTVSSESDPVSVVIDNSAPVAPLTVSYATSAGGSYTPLDAVCPVVRRGTTPSDMYFKVRLQASASHMRSAQMWASGCGSGSFQFISGTGGHHPGGTAYQHWHQSVLDNSQTMEAIYRLPAGAAEGTYSFGALVVGRAFTSTRPEYLVPPPEWDENTSEIWTRPTASFSVFNSNP